MVRYSRFSPSTSRVSFFTTVPAPWCGYTTLSPTLYKPDLPFRIDYDKAPAGEEAAGKSGPVYRSGREKARFSRDFIASGAKPLLAGRFLAGLLRPERGAHRPPDCFDCLGVKAPAAFRPRRDDHGREAELRALLEAALGLGSGA